MADERIIKFFLGPTFLIGEWETRNPFLQRGEMGFVQDGQVVKQAKVGPGYWNDLDWFGQDYYGYNEVVTNVIGDASGNLNGQSAVSILHKMLFPYQVPLVTTIINDAGGLGFLSEQLIEIGQAIAGPVKVNYLLTNPLNLSGGTPVNVSAGGVFNNEGAFANFGQVSLTLSSPLNPAAPITVTIQMSLTHLNGISPASTTKIKIAPKIIWGISPLTSMPDSATFNAISGKQTIISDDYKKDYSFAGNGYSWIGIPGMLSPSNLVFTDVTNPDAPAGYSVSDMGSLVVNNGVGTYLYQLFRSDYFILSPSKLRIRQAT